MNKKIIFLSGLVLITLGLCLTECDKAERAQKPRELKSGFQGMDEPLALPVTIAKNQDEEDKEDRGPLKGGSKTPPDDQQPEKPVAPSCSLNMPVDRAL